MGTAGLGNDEHARNGDEIGWAARQAQARRGTVRHGGRDKNSFRIFEARIIGTLFETNKKCYECFEENGVWAWGFSPFPGSRWCGSRRRRVG